MAWDPDGGMQVFFITINKTKETNTSLKDKNGWDGRKLC
jgi:hypothetical protein